MAWKNIAAIFHMLFKLPKGMGSVKILNKHLQNLKFVQNDKEVSV